MAIELEKEVMDVELIEKALEEKWLNLRDYSKEEAEVFKKAMDKTEVILNARLSNNYYDLLEKELLENISGTSRCYRKSIAPVIAVLMVVHHITQ